MFKLLIIFFLLLILVSKKQKKEKFSKQKKTQKKKKQDSNIQKIIRICNDVLIDNEKACNCFDKGLPTEKMRNEI